MFFFLFYFQGKELYACTLAISSFKSILETLGGENEKQRGRFVQHNLIIITTDLFVNKVYIQNMLSFLFQRTSEPSD